MSSTNKTWITVIIVLAAIGLVDASYLTWQHYVNAIPPCTIHGCETVLTSKYATIGPIPVALLGALYYAAMVGMAILIRLGKTRWWTLLTVTVSFGLAFTAVLVYLQGWVIHAWCQYCLVSAATTTLLFVSIVTARPRRQPLSPLAP